MALNLTNKYSSLIDERFKLQSLTDKYAGKKYEFDGAKSIKVYSIDKVTLNDYDRAAPGARYGTITELGDTVQTMTLTQDKSFTFSIDHGNAADQLNVKHCNEQLKSNWDEVCTPVIDKYRLAKWINGSGITSVNATELTSETVMRAILLGASTLSNAMVPKSGRALFIKESVYVETKLAKEIAGVDSLGEKAIANGIVGRIDGMDVVPVVDSFLPAGVNFLIKHKDATIDPVKLKTLRVQKNPLGYDADIGECRFYHDSFVLDNKIDGIYVHSTSGTAMPVIAISSNSVTVNCATSGATIKYTTDGTNPKTSETAANYSAPVPIAAGKTIRVYAYKTGLLNSGVSTAVNG